ncbi:MAG: J domain-containing protein, partial [Sphingomicrobium sp.]
MIPDHYATLGLSPSSEDVVIRAAYRALMRRYHPDGNSTAAAAARTRAINAAYAVLSDPDRRAEYDQSRAAEAWVDISARPLTGLPSRLFAASAILLVLVLVLLVVWSPLPKLERPDRLGHAPGPKVAAADPPLLPEVARFADQPTAADEPAPKVQLNRPPASATPPATPSPRLTAPVKVPPPAPRVRPAPQPQLAAARP